MREREKDDRVEGPAIVQIDTPGGTSYFNAGVNWSGEYKRITDEVHPGFSERKKKGFIMIGDLDVYSVSRTNSQGSASLGTHPSWGSRKLTGDLAGLLERSIVPPNLVNGLNDPRVLRMESLAIAEMYAKVEEAALLGGEMLGTLAQTVSMLRRPFSGAVKLLTNIHGRKTWLLRNQPRLTSARASAQAWLEQRYGWGPLIGDSFAILEEAGKIADKMKGQRLSVRDRKSAKLSSTTPWTFGPGVVPGTHGARCTARREIIIRVGAGVFVNVSPRSFSSQLAKSLGLDAASVPATLYELMPFSFVADWAVNMGTWLQAVTPKPGVKYLGGWTTSVVETYDTISDCSCFVTVDTAPKTTFTASFAGSGSKSTLIRRRKHVTGPPLSHPTLKGNFLTTVQTIDACSLLLNPVRRLLSELKH